MNNTNNMVKIVEQMNKQIEYLEDQLIKVNMLYTNTPVEAEVGMLISQMEMDLSKLSVRMDKIIQKISGMTYNYRK